MKAGGKEGQRGRGQGAEVQHGEREPENGRRKWKQARKDRRLGGRKRGKGAVQRRSQGRAVGRWREIEENPTGRGPDGRWWGGAYGIRRKNERSLRAGVRELEGGQGGCGEY